MPPVTDGSGQDRDLLRRADALLREAGCKRDGNVLRLPDGKAFEVEFLDFSGSLQPHTGSLIKNMKLVGIEARFRVVDAAQYQRRVESFDFDIVTRRSSMGVTPGEGLKLLFGSRSAGMPGSSNISASPTPPWTRWSRPRWRPTRAPTDHGLPCAGPRAAGGALLDPDVDKAAHWLAYWDMYGRPARSRATTAARRPRGGMRRKRPSESARRGS